MDEQIEWETSRREWNTSCCAHTRARARTHGCARVYASASHDVSRRSSRQILFRKIGLPLSSTTERQQLCVRRILPTYQYHVTCVGAGASEKLSRLSPPLPPSNLSFSSNIQSLAFLFCAPDRDTSRIFFFFFFRYISTMRNDVARYGECRRTIGSRDPRLPITRDNIADRSLRVVATFARSNICRRYN